MQDNELLYIRMQCKAIQWNVIQCNAVQCNMMQCDAKKCNVIKEIEIRWNEIK